MRSAFCLLLTALLLSGATAGAQASTGATEGRGGLISQAPTGKWAIVMHGGAGVIERSSMTPERDREYREGLKRAMAAAAAVLDRNGAAVDAVEAALTIFEDDPLFNAGRGAVFTADGRNELDAAIMDGHNQTAGAVAGITETKHPISLAKAVMLHSGHVMLAGAGAEQFARSAGLPVAPPCWFFTEARWQGLLKQLKRENQPLPQRPTCAPPAPKTEAAWRNLFQETPDAHKWGTTGIVVRTRSGDIAAGTTTGGVQAKRWGRIGDSPIIGAGTYAANSSCAVSATGVGEYFIRFTVARTICALVQYEHMPLQKAADTVIQGQLKSIGGDGGVIALTPDGQMVWSYNTPGMFRARQVEGGAIVTGIYNDEP